MPRDRHRGGRARNQQMALLMIILIVFSGFLMYLAGQYFFATLWSASTGNAVLELTHNGPFSTDEIMSAGSKTYTFTLSARPISGGRMTGMSVLYTPPKVYIENPLRPMGVVVGEEFFYTGYTLPATRTAGSITATTTATRTYTTLTTSGTVVSTTTRTTTTTATLPPLHTSNPEMTVSGAGWDAVSQYQAGTDYLRTPPILLKAGQQVEYTVTLEASVAIPGEILILRGLNPNSMGIESSRQINLPAGKTITYTVTSSCSHNDAYYAMMVNIHVDIHGINSLVGATYTSRILQCSTTTSTETFTSATGTMQKTVKYFHAVYIDGPVIFGGDRPPGSGSRYSSLTPAERPVSISVSSTFTADQLLHGYNVLIDVKYLTIELTIFGSGPTEPTRVTIDPLFWQKYEITVDVPIGGTVSASYKLFNNRVTFNTRDLVIAPNSLFYIRNVVTNVNDWSISFEIVNNYAQPATFVVGIPGNVMSSNQFITQSVTVPAKGSATVKLNVGNYVSEAMVRQAQTDPRSKISFTVGVVWVAPDLRGTALYSLVKDEQKFEAVFNVARLPSKVSVTAEGPGTVSVSVNGRKVGGPGSYDVLTGDEITIEAIPRSQDDFLCSVEARYISGQNAGQYMRYEPCDVFVKGGDKILPKKWTFIAPEEGFVIKFTFKNIADPDVIPHRQSRSGWLDLINRIRIVGKGEVLGYSVREESTGKVYISFNVKGSWTIYNDWDFPFSGYITLKVKQYTEPGSIPASFQDSTQFITVQPKSSVTVSQNYAVADAPVKCSGGKCPANAVFVVGGDFRFDAGTEYQVVENGKLYTLHRDTAGSLPLVTWYFPLEYPYRGESRGGETGGGPNVFNQRTVGRPIGSAYTTDGAGAGVQIDMGYVNGGVSGSTSVTDTGVALSYAEVPATYRAVDSSGNTVSSGSINMIEVPPAVSPEKVKIGAPIVQQSLPASKSLWAMIVDFFRGIYEAIVSFFARLMGGA